MLKIGKKKQLISLEYEINILIYSKTNKRVYIIFFIFFNSFYILDRYKKNIRSLNK